MIKLLEIKRTKLVAKTKFILDTYPFKDRTGKLIFEELPAAMSPNQRGLRRRL